MIIEIPVLNVTVHIKCFEVRGEKIREEKALLIALMCDVFAQRSNFVYITWEMLIVTHSKYENVKGH